MLPGHGSGPPAGRRAPWLGVAIQNAGQGNEKESARRWMDAHPDVVARMAPVTG
ncbi:hypothetical protein [Streptomyces sp. 7N604]|uniref:hypothetical protein n=1 Tax=Streptomyces sp. 7N604 TaxID=3457415 RepID=UPI003FD5521D